MSERYINTPHRPQEDVNEELCEKLYIAIRALKLIKQSYGQVCDEFEICTHSSCQSSYGCWETANIALRKITGVGNKDKERNMNFYEARVVMAILNNNEPSEIITLARIAKGNGSDDVFILELAGAVNSEQYPTLIKMAKESLILRLTGVE